MAASSLTPSEHEFTRVALERRLVTARQVHECVERRREGDHAHVAGMLTRLGYLDGTAAAALQREVHRVLTHRTALELAADMERYLESVQLGATGAWHASAKTKRRTRRFSSVRAVTGVTAAALVLAGGGLAYARWQRTRPHDCGPTLSTRHELETFVTEVGNQQIQAKAQLSSAAARHREGDLDGAQADVVEAIRILDELPLLVLDFSFGFSPGIRPALEAHLREEQPEVAALHRDALVELGRIHVARGGPDDLATGLACLRQALERTPGSPEVLLEVGKVQALQGELEAARSTLQSILESDRSCVDARLELARVHELAGDHEAALECYSHVIERGARPARAHLLRGQTRFRLGLVGPALADFERVVAIKDDSYEGYLWLGRARTALGAFGEANEALTEAIDLNPALPEAYAARGELYATQGRHDAAIKDFEVALSRSAQHHAARLGISRASEALLDDERARATYDELLQATDPEARALAPTAHAALGELSLVNADPFECEREARATARQRAAAVDDTLGPWPPLARTRQDATRLRAERLQAAAHHFTKALALAPEHVAALLGRGRLALTQGALDEAQRDLRAVVDAVERRPRDEQASRRPLADAQALLGLIALRQGQADRAATAFARALEAQPTCALALAGLGHLALQAGDVGAARTLLVRARADEAASAFTLEGERQADVSRRSRRPHVYAAARRCFARAVHENPLDARADLARAQVCAEWGSWDEAVALTARAVASDPLLREAHERLGFLFARELPLERDRVTGHPDHLREPARAEAHFTDALALAAGDVDASCDALFGRALARSAREPSDLPAARTDLHDALRALPVDLRQVTSARLRRSIEALDLLATLEERAGDLDLARAAHGRASALREAARAAAREELKAAEQLRDRLDYSTAIKRLDRALELEPELASALHLRGTCYLKIGNFVPGILDFARALELDARLADAFFLKVYQVSYVVDLNRVITELTKIVSDHPDVAHVLFLRGFFYFAKTEYKRFDHVDIERGVADFDRCLELNPKFVTARLYRGFLHFKGASLHDQLSNQRACHERALADYQGVLTLDPASGGSHFLQALLWSVRSCEEGLTPDEVSQRKQRSLEALRAAVACGLKPGERVKNEKGFDAVRAEPAFVELMRGR